MLCLSVCALLQDASAARAPAQRPRALTPRAHTRAHAHTRTQVRAGRGPAARATRDVIRDNLYRTDKKHA